MNYHVTKPTMYAELNTRMDAIIGGGPSIYVQSTGVCTSVDVL